MPVVPDYFASPLAATTVWRSSRGEREGRKNCVSSLHSPLTARSQRRMTASTYHHPWRTVSGAGWDEGAGHLQSCGAWCQGQILEGWRQRRQLTPSLLGFVESMRWRLGCLPACFSLCKHGCVPAPWATEHISSTALFARASYKLKPWTHLAALYAGTAGVLVPVPLASCVLP